MRDVFAFMLDFESIGDRILFVLKLEPQTFLYKAAQKALNQLIQQIKLMDNNF